MADNYDTCDTIAAVAVSAVLWKPKNVKKCLPERALLRARRFKTSGELGEFHRPCKRYGWTPRDFVDTLECR